MHHYSVVHPLPPPHPHLSIILIEVITEKWTVKIRTALGISKSLVLFSLEPYRASVCRLLLSLPGSAGSWACLHFPQNLSTYRHLVSPQRMLNIVKKKTKKYVVSKTPACLIAMSTGKKNVQPKSRELCFIWWKFLGLQAREAASQVTLRELLQGGKVGSQVI